MSTSTKSAPWYKLKRVWSAIVAAALIGAMAFGGLDAAEIDSVQDFAGSVIDQVVE